jgi:hypothetical protein
MDTSPIDPMVLALMQQQPQAPSAPAHVAPQDRRDANADLIQQAIEAGYSPLLARLLLGGSRGPGA